MKPLVATILIALSLPAMAQSVDISSMTPTLTWPDPVPEPVTKDAAGIDE